MLNEFTNLLIMLIELRFATKLNIPKKIERINLLLININDKLCFSNL